MNVYLLVNYFFIIDLCKNQKIEFGLLIMRNESVVLVRFDFRCVGRGKIVLNVKRNIQICSKTKPADVWNEKKSSQSIDFPKSISACHR